jgi:hypothetical protein
MTGYNAKKAAAQAKLQCQCSMTTKLVGSGCQYCNPEYMDDQDDDAQPAQEPDEWFEGWRVQDFHDACKKPAQEPVVLVALNSSGQLRMQYQDGSAFDISKHVGERFYTTPPAAQPVGQAPCVRHCESTAYEIVIRGLKGDIERMKAAQRTWVGLTKEDKDLVKDCCEMMIGDAAFSTIEAILKGNNGFAEEKNT